MTHFMQKRLPTFLRSPLGCLGLFFGLLTLVIAPWRNSSPQDDAAWTYSVVSLLGGGGAHFGIIAVGLTQMAVGLLAVKFLAFLPAISIMNFSTWLCFLATVFLFWRVTRIHWLVLASFFAFPVWIQYGSIFHGEVYSSFLLILLLGFLNEKERFVKWQLPLAGALSFLLGTQLQNMAAFPFFWGFFLLFGKNKSLGIALMIGAVLSVVSFALMPKSPWQTSYGYWMAKTWTDQSTASAMMNFVMYMTQIFVASGLFLLPGLQFKGRSAKSYAAVTIVFCLSTLFLARAEIAPMSGGVMFLEYFPRTLGALVLSAGVFGWWGLIPHVRKVKIADEFIPIYGTLVAWVVIWLFCTYRFTLDIRYTMTWGIPIFFHLRHRLRDSRFLLGAKVPFLIAVTSVSVICNVYYLNTTDARWQAASEIEVTTGVAKTEIGAGYGWNVFYTSDACMKSAISKIETQSDVQPFWKSDLFYKRFLTLYGRTYEDEWVPRYVIKPSKMLGKQIDLRKYRLPGQEKEPVRLIDYTVLGLPSQLAVFENKETHPAWCDQ